MTKKHLANLPKLVATPVVQKKKNMIDSYNDLIHKRSALRQELAQGGEGNSKNGIK